MSFESRIMFEILLNWTETLNETTIVFYVYNCHCAHFRPKNLTYSFAVSLITKLNRTQNFLSFILFAKHKYLHEVTDAESDRLGINNIQ